MCFIQIALTVPETYAPTLLANKAARRRKETGDERYYSLTEREPKRTLGQKLENILARPFKMLAREPMLSAITAYMSFVYGCIYLLFEVSNFRCRCEGLVSDDSLLSGFPNRVHQRTPLESGGLRIDVPSSPYRWSNRCFGLFVVLLPSIHSCS